MDTGTQHGCSRGRWGWMLVIAMVALSGATVTAHAQGTRKVIPQGFEFPDTMSTVRYHFPRGSIKPAVMIGTWFAENVENVKPNLEIDAATLKLTNEPVAHFSLSNKGKWPSGVYRLEIRSDGQLVHTVRFTVR